jgi:hypothetical protein
MYPGHHHLDVRDVRGILSKGACVCLHIVPAAYAYRPLLMYVTVVLSHSRATGNVLALLMEHSIDISTGRMTGRETGAFLSIA